MVKALGLHAGKICSTLSLLNMDSGIDRLARNKLRRAERQTRDLGQQHTRPVFLVAAVIIELSAAMQRPRYGQTLVILSPARSVCQIISETPTSAPGSSVEAMRRYPSGRSR